MEGVQETLVPGEGQDTGARAARNVVVVRVLPRVHRPDRALQPRVVGKQPVDQLVRADILGGAGEKRSEAEAFHYGALREQLEAASVVDDGP